MEVISGARGARAESRVLMAMRDPAQTDDGRSDGTREPATAAHTALGDRSRFLYEFVLSADQQKKIGRKQ